MAVGIRSQAAAGRRPRGHSQRAPRGGVTATDGCRQHDGARQPTGTGGSFSTQGIGLMGRALGPEPAPAFEEIGFDERGEYQEVRTRALRIRMGGCRGPHSSWRGFDPGRPTIGPARHVDGCLCQLLPGWPTGERDPWWPRSRLIPSDSSWPRDLPLPGRGILRNPRPPVVAAIRPRPAVLLREAPRPCAGFRSAISRPPEGATTEAPDAPASGPGSTSTRYRVGLSRSLNL